MRKLIPRRTLRLARHTDTSVNIGSIYPFVAEAPASRNGPRLGTNVLTGADGFWYDPFTAYEDGLITNPNVLIAGEPGAGKSTATKTLLYRAATQFERKLAIVDPKGEYRPLASALGLQIVNLFPGGSTRLNPLDASHDSLSKEELRRQRTMFTSSLLATVLKRDLTSLEAAAIGWAVEELETNSKPPTLDDLKQIIAKPTRSMTKQANRLQEELSREIEPLRYALERLLSQTLSGMFDGQSTVSLEPRSPGIVIELSRVTGDSEAMAMVLVAATSWLRRFTHAAQPAKRIQVLDEAWTLLKHPNTSRYLQESMKLGRAHGVANVLVVHRLSDLRSQDDDGTASNKIASGLLADAQTRAIFRQSSDQIPDARSMLSLTSRESEILARLSRGRAIWKVGHTTAVVQHDVLPEEQAFCDTDARMRTESNG